MNLADSRPWWRDGRWWLLLFGPLPFWGIWAWFSPPAGLWLTVAPTVWVNLVLLWPLAEELLFRGVVQGWLLRRWPASSFVVFGISLANGLTSLVFTAMHLWLHPGWLALAVMLPSLAFGWTRERHRSLLSPCLLHMFYNAGWFWLQPPAGF